MIKTRTGNCHQAQSNFYVTSFRHQLISTSIFSSRSNRDVTSFRSDMGTNQRTDQQTNGWTNRDQPTDGRTNGPTDQRMDQHSLL
jgi:hypothetical protein